MKPLRLAALLLLVAQVGLGATSKAKTGSKPIELPVCRATMAWGTPCVWFGMAELNYTPPQGAASSNAPASDPTPRPDPETFPTTFEVSSSDVGAAWGRAQAFVAQHASMKIQTATDFVIETYNPSQSSNIYQFGYRVIKTPLQNGRSFSISINCVSIGRPGSEIARLAERTAHYAAYFIATGDPVTLP